MSILNDRIRERRDVCGLTLLDVAERIGVQEATMQRYESGQIKNIKHETILALSEVFKCSPSYLMGWIDNLVELPAPTVVQTLKSDEKNLLDNYRSLSAEGKKYLQQTMKAALNTYRIEPANDTVRVFRAAYSEEGKDSEIVELPRSTIDKLKAAKPADEI